MCIYLIYTVYNNNITGLRKRFITLKSLDKLRSIIKKLERDMLTTFTERVGKASGLVGEGNILFMVPGHRSVCSSTHIENHAGHKRIREYRVCYF